MSLIHIAFWGFTVLSGLVCLTIAGTKRVIYAGFLLFGLLMLQAGLYVLSGAAFLAMGQIIVYVGGVLVLILFGVMLTHRIHDVNSPKKNTQPISYQKVINQSLGVLVACGMFGLLFYGLHEFIFEKSAKLMPHDGLQQIGMLLMTDYLFAFELASIFLLIGLIGAAFLARKARD